ncbi:MAG: hypothetical protein ACKVQJ_12355 [Pyrinomonadaceae bacterium]
MNTDNERSSVVDINNEQAFTPDPLNKMMGIFEDSDAGVSAAEDLKANGFDEKDIELFCGVPGAETYDFTGDEHGLGAKFMRAFRNITFDRIIMDRYQTALRDGHCVLMVHIHKKLRRDEAASIMNRYGAVQVDHFGLAMTKAYPDNPESSENKYDIHPLNQKG